MASINLTEIVRQEHDKTGLTGVALMSHIRSNVRETRLANKETLRSYCNNLKNIQKVGANGKTAVKTKAWAGFAEHSLAKKTIDSPETVATRSEPAPFPSYTPTSEEVSESSQLSKVLRYLTLVVGPTKAKEIATETIDGFGLE